MRPLEKLNLSWDPVNLTVEKTALAGTKGFIVFLATTQIFEDELKTYTIYCIKSSNILKKFGENLEGFEFQIGEE
ncbi:unnamed protein product [Onchocerca flexuosa]|uniref:PH domain-containing protein n=1 Tax=Onchocerca flexuosa TaxID=387005 RepID=A0A183I095_9BILA|nr:unnamed protein product [Onchocerca flexuosa]